VEGKNTVCVSFDGPRHEADVDAAGQDGSCWLRSVSHGRAKSGLGVEKTETICIFFLSFLLAINFKRRHLGHSTTPRFSNNDDFLLLTNQEFFTTSTCVKEPISCCSATSSLTRVIPIRQKGRGVSNCFVGWVWSIGC
jgi:hypothetical protein